MLRIRITCSVLSLLSKAVFIFFKIPDLQESVRLVRLQVNNFDGNVDMQHQCALSINVCVFLTKRVVVRVL